MINLEGKTPEEKRPILGEFLIAYTPTSNIGKKFVLEQDMDENTTSLPSRPFQYVDLENVKDFIKSIETGYEYKAPPFTNGESGVHFTDLGNGEWKEDEV